MHFNKSRKMSVIALTRKQKIGKTEGWHHNVHPMMPKLLRIGLELFACGQGIWRQMFDRCRLLIGSCFWKISKPLIPPYVTCVTVLTLKQISGREGNAILINESNKNKLTKKKQRRFACNYIALVSDFIWSWYAFKNAAEVCIIRHFNKTLVELQQKLNNIKNQCLTKFLAKPWRTTWDSAVDVLP